MTKEMIAALKLAASSQGIPPEAVDKVVEIADDMNAMIRSTIDRNFAQARAADLAAVEALKRLGEEDLAKGLLEDVVGQMVQENRGDEDDGSSEPQPN
jgi:hypothetical protein